jgi:CubicO group peptidase (beta-lactamase class C family)
MLRRLILMLLPFAMSINVIADTGSAQSSDQSAEQYEPTDAMSSRRAVTIDNWDDGGAVSRYVYLHTSEIFPTATIFRGRAVIPLEEAPNAAIGEFVVSRENGRETTLAEYLADQDRIDGFIILHRGKVVYEAYPNMQPRQKHQIFSVTKVFIGTVVGILDDQGKIDIDRPAADYIAELEGTAWANIHVRDILDMASGMEGANESYTDPANKHFQYEASLGLLPKTPDMPDFVKQEETYRYLASLKHLRRPGEVWEYASVNTALLAWLLEEITGKRIDEVLSEYIWAPMGAESDAQIIVNSKGSAATHAGMVMSLRDLARFGLLFTPSWSKTAQRRIVSEDLLTRILEADRPHLVKEWLFGPRPDWLSHVAYQWDAVTNEGRLVKGGFGGQLLYIAPESDVVIAHLGTNRSIDDAPPQLNLAELVDTFFDKPPP